jgi:diphthamide biosynthesis enzyme Dph1/Dph2-like protein
VKYVFGKAALDVDALIASLNAEFKSASDRVAVFYDVAFHHKAAEIEKRLKSGLTCKVSVAKLKRSTTTNSKTEEQPGAGLEENTDLENTLQTTDSSSIEFCGRHFRSNATNAHLDGWSVIYIGPENRSLTSTHITLLFPLSV